ncbi:MAG: hypothetical protein AAF211_32875, partial [Myxococcota bacterium]
TVYCLDTDNNLVQAFTTGTNTFVPIPQLTNLVGPRAVGASDALGDNWIAVTGSQVQVWEVDGNGIVADNPVFSGPIDADNPIRDIVAYDGYLLGGGASGRVHIVTARPWIERESFTISPDSVTSGETVTVTFTLAQPEQGTVNWEVHRGGDRTSGSGVLLDAGTTSAGQEVTVEFQADGLAEGASDVFVVVTGADDLTGHIAGSVVVDNIPSTPVITRQDVGWGNRRIELTFDGIGDADLDSYEVCVSTEPFEPTDFPEGCPTYTGASGFVNPFVEQADPDTVVTISIEPLENDVKHYIAVRAVDQGGQVSPLSRVVSETPSYGVTAAGLAQETGGSPCTEGCSTSGGRAWGLGLAALLAVGLVRRRGVAALFFAAMVGSLAVATPALAQDDDGQKSIWLRKDSTPVRGDFEFRYGSFVVDDPEIRRVHGNSINLWQIEVGPQIFRVAEIDFGIALANPRSSIVNENNGARSLDDTRLRIIPVNVDVTLRAHILDEQPVVPFVRYGWDYAFFRDSRVGDDRAEPITGAKIG